MDLINEMIIPFNKFEEIDLPILNKLISLSKDNYNDNFLLFSPLLEGDNLTINEKIEIIKYLDNISSNGIIYFQLSDSLTNNILIDALNNSKISTIFINPPKNSYYSQEGLYLLTKAIVKLLVNKNIILVNSSMTNHVFYQFQTIKKLTKKYKNIIGIYEDSYDYSLINLLKKHCPNFKIYINEKSLSKAFSLDIDGIISISSIAFGNLYSDLFKDYKNGYLNEEIVNDIKFINEILLFNNNSTLIKTYLKKTNIKSMNVRLPLVTLKKDEENLDFLLS